MPVLSGEEPRTQANQFRALISTFPRPVGPSFVFTGRQRVGNAGLECAVLPGKNEVLAPLLQEHVRVKGDQDT